ncbi:hypothetical protein PLICRDRAFT_462928 [Plicaturopsis crispa FD-325 SS-3]|nr:hypothetical protein PLICRDRAFT_462928 [Plicaturopsis crispa FD-325 SS-3]
MTRGRKKDLTIPPSRALTQQRDYRARKAQYIADLEERYRQSEAENVRLREEIEKLKAGLLPSSQYDSETALASTELRKQLVAATEAMEHFRRLAFPEPSAPSEPSTSATKALRPAAFPSPAPSPPFYSFSAAAAASEARSQRYTPPHSSGSPEAELRDRRHIDKPSHHSRPHPSPSPSLGSECCGGYVDCRGLVEEDEDMEDELEEDELDDTDTSPTRDSFTRTSRVRST